MLVIAPSLIASFVYVFVFTAVDALYLAVEQLVAADLRIRRPQTLFRAVVQPALEDRLRQSVLLQRLLCRAGAGDRSRARHRDRPARARAKRSGARSFSIRSRFRSSVTGTVWSWLYSPDAGIEFFVRSLGWTRFHFPPDDRSQPRDLCDHRDRRLAVLRLCDGAVSRRAALGRSRHRQGGADRRRGPVAHLSQGDPAGDRADLHRGRRSCCCNSRSRPSISSLR